MRKPHVLRSSRIYGRHNKSDGALYFTDPPYGLLKQDDDPAKELKFNGVFRYAGGKLQVVVKDLDPNGTFRFAS